MSYQALARKWRPQSFSDIIGQDSVVRTLQHAIEQERIHHAYLFSGVRGVGKTTAARIFAKAVNCANGPAIEPCNRCSTCIEITEGIDLDVREIDAATYTQVDNIRELREVSQFQPARDRKRIFIIDEAHMLSTPAWNALLKLIEEPPPHVAFIMATTEMQKVPATILSRVQRLVFRKITNAEVAARLGEICVKEGVEIDAASLNLIARRGEGSVRDSLSLLDQVIAFSGTTVTFSEVTSTLGLSDSRFFAGLVTSIREGDHGAILDQIEEASAAGRDLKLLYRDLLSFLRTMLLVVSGARDPLLNVDADELEAVRDAASAFDYSDLLRIVNLLMQDDELVTRAEHQRLAVEIALLKAATFPRLKRVEDLLRGVPDERLAAPVRKSERATVVAPVAKLERALSATSVPAVRPTSAPPPTSDMAEETVVRAAGGDGIRERFVERVRAGKKLAATYLEQSKVIRFDQDLLIVEFDAANDFFVQSLNEKDQLAFLKEAASAELGRPASVKVRQAEPEKNDERRRTPVSALTEDPIVKAIAKHLGGEIIPPKNSKQRSETR
ncbi:MAG TPA: DNA polymerase III subunit gamma/tau [Thermoanaerobaculia bacterium]|nr:DNA polymerase III subunit gamma/tau [Thermoanaerobaculia bacterium]